MKIVLVGRAVSLVEPDDVTSFSVVASPDATTAARTLTELGHGGDAEADGHVAVRIDSVRRLADGRVGGDWNEKFSGMLAYAERKGWVTADGESIVAHIEPPTPVGVPLVTLNSGHPIPQLGLGLFRVPRDQTERVVSEALEVGYRHFDTAVVYGNEAELGAALRSSGIPREEIFVSTKLRTVERAPDDVPAGLDQSLDALGLDYVDLYLVDWPAPRFNRYVDTWQVLEHLQRGTKVRSIGVANFLPHHLERLLPRAEVVPAVNQLERHPDLQQVAAAAFSASHGIAVVAASPLASGRLPLLEAPTIVAAASAHGRTPAQIALRWHVQVGSIVLAKASSAARLRENLAIFDFALDDAEMTAISAMERGARVGFHPDEFH